MRVGNGIFYFYGIDGSGKSTIAYKAKEILEKKGYRVSYRWLRQFHVLAKLVNILGRACGLSVKKKYNDDVCIGYHYYGKNKVISIIYKIATLFDSVLALVLFVYYPYILGNKVLIIDRFLIDTFIDVCVDTNDPSFIRKTFPQLLLKALPRNTRLIFIKTSRSHILQRRPDIIHDEMFDKRFILYEEMQHYLRSIVVDNDGSLEASVNALEKVFCG